jgi:hypothetical protein
MWETTRPSKSRMLQVLNSKRRNYQQRNVQMAIATLLLALIGVVAVVAVWRGLWGLMDIYLWPNNPKRSNWVSFIVGFVTLAVIVGIATHIGELNF